ncbi:MAG TPA: alpha-E domain-containing protein [Polyangiaceae bacterium]|nr:alpha-E domain-containing protein [Polyangiaceae bacterium]
MLSRAAEAVYWMSRYAERAENVARFLQVSLEVTLDVGDPRGDAWPGIIAATGDQALFTGRYGDATRDSVLRFLTIDAESPNSILSCLRLARDNARSIQEAISSEMWQQINKWYLLVREAAAAGSVLDDPHDFLTAVKEASHLFVGLTYLTMTHGEGWHFGRLGRLLERADQTSRIIDAKQTILFARPLDVVASLDEVHLSGLLRSVSALEMYRKRHGRIEHGPVIEFLVLDKLFPRSIRHCLDNAQESLRAIAGTPAQAPRSRAERLLGRLGAEYENAVVEEILAEGLHDHCDRMQLKLNDVGLAIYETFFATRPEAPSTADDAVQLAEAAQ